MLETYINNSKKVATKTRFDGSHQILAPPPRLQNNPEAQVSFLASGNVKINYQIYGPSHLLLKLSSVVPRLVMLVSLQLARAAFVWLIICATVNG